MNGDRLPRILPYTIVKVRLPSTSRDHTHPFEYIIRDINEQIRVFLGPDSGHDGVMAKPVHKGQALITVPLPRKITESILEKLTHGARPRLQSFSCEGTTLSLDELLGRQESEPSPANVPPEGKSDDLARENKGLQIYAQRLEEEKRELIGERDALQAELRGRFTPGELEEEVQREAKRVRESFVALEDLSNEALLIETFKRIYGPRFAQAAHAFDEAYPSGVSQEVEIFSIDPLRYILLELGSANVNKVGINTEELDSVGTLDLRLKELGQPFENSRAHSSRYERYQLAQAYVLVHSPTTKKGDNRLFDQQLVLVEEYEHEREEWNKRRDEARNLSPRLKTVRARYERARKSVEKDFKKLDLSVGCYVYAKDDPGRNYYSVVFVLPMHNGTTNSRLALRTLIGINEVLKDHGSAVDFNTTRGAGAVEILYERQNKPSPDRLKEIIAYVDREINTTTTLAGLGIRVELSYFGELQEEERKRQMQASEARTADPDTKVIGIIPLVPCRKGI